MASHPGLQQLGFGKLLDAALKLFGRHWRVLTLCALVASAPAQILGVLVVLGLTPEQLELGGEPATLDTDDPDLVLAGVSLQLLSLLTYLLAVAACSAAIVDAHAGREPSAGRSLGAFARRLPALVLLFLVMAPCLLLAFAALIVPGIWLAGVWSLVVPALVAERLAPTAALGRSFNLVKGHFWLVLGLLLVSAVVLFIAQLVLGALLGSIVAAAGSDGRTAGAAITAVSGVVANALVLPVIAAALWLLYFHRTGEHDAPQQPEPEAATSAAPAPAPPPAGDAPSGWQPPVAPDWPPRG
jgi:hypothetical protein